MRTVRLPVGSRRFFSFLRNHQKNVRLVSSILTPFAHDVPVLHATRDQNTAWAQAPSQRLTRVCTYETCVSHKLGNMQGFPPATTNHDHQSTSSITRLRYHAAAVSMCLFFFFLLPSLYSPLTSPAPCKPRCPCAALHTLRRCLIPDLPETFFRPRLQG